MDKRFKPLSPSEQLTIRRQLLEHIAANPGQPVVATIAAVRGALRMTVPEYAKVCGVSAKLLYELEGGRGNPSLKTVEKLLKPLGLHLGVVVAPAPAR